MRTRTRHSAAVLSLIAAALRLTAALTLLSTITAQPASSQTPTPHPPASNAQLSSPAIERRVDDLLKRMTLEEKLGQLVQYDDSNSSEAPPPADANDPTLTLNPKASLNPIATLNPKAQGTVDPMQLAAAGRLGSMVSTVGAAHTDAFQHAAMDRSRLHIPLLFSADVIHGYRTLYPPPIGLASSFDPALVTSLAHMAGAEAATAGIRWVYSPMVDISRDARWGRTLEGAGEDAYLGAAIARAWVHGYQGDDLSKPDSVAAGVKHFAAYGAVEAGRDYNTTDMSLSRLHQVYLPPYEAAVEAGAATIMSAFTSLNGVPPTASTFLLQQILRDSWGFNGLVVSDWMAIEELENHGIALDAATATRKAITAGVDIDMMSHLYDTQLQTLIQSGQVPIATIDKAVRRVLRLKFAMGLFEHPYARGVEVTAAIPAHRPLARRGAEESFVLLQNNPLKTGAPILPLSASAKKFALIGPLADDAQDMVADNTDAIRPEPDVITLRTSLAARVAKTGGSLTYARGTGFGNASDPHTSHAGFAEAIHAAQQADVVILALGESAAMSGEAGSRANLDLPGNQQQLLEAVAATGKPIVLLIFSGRPLVLTWAAEHLPCIMAVWFPGVEAGPAITGVLFGDTSPSGKLPMSLPRAVGQEPLYYNQFPTGRPARDLDLTPPATPNTRFLSRYIDMRNDALFPFGHGLSYTQFTYSDAQVSRPTLPLAEAQSPVANKLVSASITIRNDGSRAAIEVVQCYVGNLGASLEQPMRSLQGFQRIPLEPGESRRVTFNLGFPELSFFNNDGHSVIEPTHYNVWLGGSSLAREHAAFIITP